MLANLPLRLQWVDVSFPGAFSREGHKSPASYRVAAAITIIQTKATKFMTTERYRCTSQVTREIVDWQVG